LLALLVTIMDGADSARAAPPPDLPRTNTTSGRGEHNGAYTGWGIDAAWETIVAYSLGWITGLIVVCSEQDCFYCVFHGFQSIILSTIETVVLIIAIIIDAAVLYKKIHFPICIFFWLLAYVIVVGLCIVMGFKNADSGKLFRLPGVGQLAEYFADRFFPTDVCGCCCV